MKKITLLSMVLGLMISTTSLTAQTYFSAAINGGTAFSSSAGSFAGYTWSGVPNYTFNNSNSKTITLVITNYDQTNPAVGDKLYINFSRVGFGNAPLGWGSDNFTNLKTLTPADFTNGTATVVVSIPTGTLPVAQTSGYVSGYNYILQVVGANPPANQTYINFVTGISETILSTKNFNKNSIAFYPNPAKDIITFGNDVISKSYKVLSMTGAVIKEAPASGTLNVSDLAKGTYIISTDSGIGKLIKE